MKTNKIVLIMALLLIAVVVPVMAENAVTVPPDEYFTTYHGAPVTATGTGLDAYVMWIPAGSNHEVSAGLQNVYLGLTPHTYKLKISHNYQEMIAMKRAFYQYTLPDFPYEDYGFNNVGRDVYISDRFDVTGVSEDPNNSTYLTASELRKVSE